MRRVWLKALLLLCLMVSVLTPAARADDDKTPAVTAKDGDTQDEDAPKTPENGFQSSFLTDRVRSEIFLGSTLAQNYDKDTGKSTGFNETSFVGALRIGTLWGPSGSSCTVADSQGWVLHTELELQFSSFPSTTDTTNTTAPKTAAADDRFVKFGDAFTGSLIGILEPASWSRYKDRFIDGVQQPGKDAFRLGIIGRVGMISRDQKTASGDTSIAYYRLGGYFEHHQTGPLITGACDDVKNVFPVRFIEVSIGHYEQIFDQKNANRLIVDAGIRLPGVGSDAIPFYAGIFLNAGKGPDDLRVYAGLLFHIDKLAQLLR